MSGLRQDGLVPPLPEVPGVRSETWVQTACATFRAQTLVASMGPDVAYVVHGDRGCGNVSKDHGTDASSQRAYFTALAEHDVVHGAEGKLRAAIRQAVADGATLVFALDTCPSRLIGEDLEGICRTEADSLGVAVIALPTCGMRWTHLFEVYEWLLVALVDRVMVPRPVRPRSVVYLGYGTPHDDRPGRNLHVLRDLLDRIGVELAAVLPCGADVEAVCRAPSAALSVCRTRAFGEAAATRMKSRFGTPWIAPRMPIGVRHTAQFLRAVAEGLDIADEAEPTIARLEADARERIDEARRLVGRPLHAALQFFPEAGAAAVGGADEVALDVAVLSDAGFEVTIYCLARPEIRDRVDRVLDETFAEDGLGARVVYYARPETLPDVLVRHQYDLCLAPTSDRKYFRAAGYPTLEVPVRDGQKQPSFGFDAAVMLSLDYLRAADSRFHRRWGEYAEPACDR